MGCVNTKIHPAKHVVSIFTIMSDLERDIFKYKFCKNSQYEEDLLLITITERIKYAREYINTSYMSDNIKEWFIRKITLYESSIISEKGINNIKNISDFNIT